MNDPFGINEVIAQIFAMLRSTWRNRWWGLAAAWPVCIAGWLFFANLPDAYESKARIYVSSGNVLGGFLRGLTVQDNVGAKVAFMLKTIHSRPNLMRLMDMTGMDTSGLTELQLENMVKRLRRTISLKHAGSNVYEIGYQAGDPQSAHDVVGAVLKFFIEGNIVESRSEMESAERFIEQQISIYETELKPAELRLVRFRQDNLEYLEGEGGYRSRVSQAQSDLAKSQSQLRDAIVRRAALQKEMTSVSQFFQQESSDDTLLRLQELEAQLEDLLSRYTEEHPDVLWTRRKIAEVGKLLEKNPEQTRSPTRRTVVRSVNPVYERVKIQLVNQQAEIATLKLRIEEAQTRLDGLNSVAEEATAVEAEHTKLRRDYDVLKNRYEKFLGQRESYRISRAQQDNLQESLFRVVEPPSMAAVAIWPNRFAYFTLTLILGLGAGGGFAFMLGMSSDTVSEIPQLRKAIALPVLGGVSFVKSQARRVGSIAETAAFAVVVLCLLAFYGAFQIIEYQVGFGTIDLANTPTLLKSAFQFFV